MTLLTSAHEMAEKALDLLEEIKHGVYDLRETEKPREEVFARKTGAITIPAGGAASLIINPPRPGWAWQLQRLATTAGSTGTLAVYLDAVDPLNLIETVAAPQMYADEFANNIYVPPGRALLFRFIGQPVGTVCTVAVQVRQYREEHDPLPAHMGL